MKKVKQYHYKPTKEEGIVLAIGIIFSEIAIALITLKFGISTEIWFLMGLIVLIIIVLIFAKGTTARTDEINDLIFSVYQDGYNAGYIDGKNGDEKEKDIIMV